MMLKEDRNIGMYILLSICTCGIYSYYFVYTMALDANTLCSGDGKKTPGLGAFILLSVLTCGLYTIYWEYSLGNRLAENAPRYGITLQENGSSVLMWRIFGALLCGIGAFVAINILIKNMNALARVYNNMNGGTMQQPYTPQQPYIPSQEYTPQQPYIPSQEYTPSQENTPQQPYTPQQEYKPQTQMPQSGGFVECCQGAYQGVVFPVEGEILIGRDEACSHIVIPSPEVSRKHCGIRYNRENGTYTVTDYSTNGLNNKAGQAFPKNVPVACQPGTVLVLGNSKNEFLLK